MSEHNGATPLTCGHCRHWVRQESPAVGHGPIDLAAAQTARQAVKGQCREGPPHLTVVPLRDGRQLHLVDYPAVNDNYPACGRFASALTLLSE